MKIGRKGRVVFQEEGGICAKLLKSEAMYLSHHGAVGQVRAMRLKRLTGLSHHEGTSFPGLYHGLSLEGKGRMKGFEPAAR